MNLHRLSCFALLAAIGFANAAAAETRADEILDRFKNRDATQRNVMVVAHRGAAFREGQEVVAENSIASLNRAVDLGVDMVEIDVRRTKDGVYVVSHDETLDRATNCTGSVEDMAFAEMSDCRLLSGPNRDVTDEAVPTLAYFLKNAKGRIMINLDNKVGAENLPGIYQVVEAEGMTPYVVTTIAANSAEDLAAVNGVMADLPQGVQLMPNVRDDRISGLDHLEMIYGTFPFEVMQGRDTYAGGELTSDGGVLFNADAQALAQKHDVHLWVNTLSFPDQPDMRSGGRGDARAVATGDLDSVYGFWAGQGVTMIQTDEPELAINYLEEKGYRQPY
ncbi:MAG: glycerophosphodiester phosphodiesterase family protein [Paracoccus sp. (in: a-proteobacteria)]|nr:glycerophosphodiester phosphodiesterase family protein [Paracoccus sp. (in: a-proteobacteria)]